MVWVLPDDVTPYAKIVTVCRCAASECPFTGHCDENIYDTTIYNIDHGPNIIIEYLFLSGRLVIT
jgi:hypothetical protein